MKILAKILNWSIPVLIITGILLAALSYSMAEAQETPSKTVQRIQKLVSENQEIITKTREAHVSFMTAKKDNDYQVRKLRELCYDLDWSSNEVTKIEDCTAGDFLQ